MSDLEKKTKLMEFWKPTAPPLWEKVEAEEPEDPLENIKLLIRGLERVVREALELKYEVSPYRPSYNTDEVAGGTNVFTVLIMLGLLTATEDKGPKGEPFAELPEEVRDALDELRSEDGRRDGDSDGDVPQAPQEGEEGQEDSSGGGSGEGSGEGGGQEMWLVEGVPLEDLEEAGLEPDILFTWANRPKR